MPDISLRQLLEKQAIAVAETNATSSWVSPFIHEHHWGTQDFQQLFEDLAAHYVWLSKDLREVGMPVLAAHFVLEKFSVWIWRHAFGVVYVVAMNPEEAVEWIPELDATIDVRNTPSSHL